MITSDYRPLLKQGVEILPAEHEGNKIIILKDNEGITNKTLVMPIESLAILQFFNGSNTIKDIQSTILKMTGELISEADIINFVKQLDEANFLENEKLAELRKKIYEDFKKETIRKSIHKGLSYPQNLLELTSFLSKFLRKDETILPSKNALGLIVPHIDIIRGGRVYASGYGELLNSFKPDIIIAFGTSHKGGNSPLILTKKDYETPYGNIETDKELFEKFREILWYEPDDEEFLHKDEHSLEFQALWLKYIWRENTPKWLPILVSNFERFASDITPSQIDTVEAMFRNIENLLKEISKNKKIMIIAGVDLSHVGPRFGDDIEINPLIKSAIETKDKEKIDYILNLDYDGFYKAVISNENETNICSVSPLYAAMRSIKAISPQSKGKLLDYAQADDPFGGFVSFASIIFQ